MIADGNDMVMPVAPAGNNSRANSDFRIELQGMIDNAPNESVRQKLMGIMNEV